MGYYTRYTLRTVDSQVDISEILITIPVDEFEDKFYGIDRSGDTNDEVKWYEHEEDMKALSREWPEVTFELSGEGEESRDIWKKYFRNGKMQICDAKITFDEFDETKLE